ncbi:MAG: HD-GYP domain-containing protein [Gammaproteobacteria bacterium]|nr:HD-GYP domain-containing protein [Gammaproteobacteria bacterium]MDH5629902.1 HD-GYP domain-containing protein [Gammaproteobacteria bacterium]
MEQLKRVKVFTDELKPGMFVSELDRSWDETDFLLQGFTVTDFEDVEHVKSQCEYVYVDFKDIQEFQAYKRQSANFIPKKNQVEEEQLHTYNLKKQLKPALARRRKTSHLMKSILDKIALSQDFDIQGVRQTVKENVKSVLSNHEAMMMITMLKSKSEDLAEHSLNVSILAIGFAQTLGYSRDQLEDIGMAALLHDIGQVKVNDNITSKPGKLNQNERLEIEKHCQYGFDILSSKTGLTPSCIDVVLTHHERLDGTGYPRKISDSSICRNAKIVSIVDAFDSLTSHQSYRKGMSVMDAYKILVAGKKTHYDESLVLKFIKWRSIYPIGSIVEMENGEVGIVVKSFEDHRLKPQVLLVLDEYKQPRQERLINMHKMDLTPESRPYKIVRAYENMAFGIDIQAYAEKGMVVQ